MAARNSARRAFPRAGVAPSQAVRAAPSAASAAVVVALGEDGVPGKPGLRALEDQRLVELAIVAHRHTPFLVVIGNGERVLGPGATDLLAHESASKSGTDHIFRNTRHLADHNLKKNVVRP